MMRKILLVFSLAFAIVMLPCVSLADDDGFSGSDGGEFYQNYGLRWSGYTHDGEWTAVLAKAPDSWYAAVLACGGNPALLTPEVRSKLSDPSYGGAFYTYATTFYHIMSIYDLPIWVPVYVLAAEGISGVWHGDFGDVWLWQSEVPNILAASALVDYNRVVSGENINAPSDGQGGAIVPVGDYYPISLIAWADNEPRRTADKASYRFSCQNATYDDGNLVLGSGSTSVSPWLNNSAYVANGILYANNDILNLADSYINQGYEVAFFFQSASCGLIYGNNLVRSYGTYTSDNNFNCYRYTGTNLHTIYFSSTPYFDSSNFVFTLVPSISSFSPVSRSNLVRLQYSSQVYSEPFYGPPSGTWPEPETPVVPTAPEVPTPTAPTDTVDPDPTAPTITWPTSPTLVLPTSPIVSTTPEGIDYTALLTLINDNLNSIDSYLQNFYTSFNSFRSDFLNGVDDIVDALRNIYQYLGHLNNILEVHCKHITDQIEESVYNLELYLKRLFEWLPRQLDFDAEYDDSAVTALLRRILNKIPGGSTGTPITYKPNPQSDEPSFWDWLADLFNRILQKLLDLLPDEMIQLGQLFGELINLFPFSIPWDLFALLALFGHEPVTPVIDIPWGYGGSSGQVMMIRIDLHAWDGVAEMVRPVFLVLFCLQLALLSRDLLKIINVKSGGE